MKYENRNVIENNCFEHNGVITIFAETIQDAQEVLCGIDFKDKQILLHVGTTDNIGKIDTKDFYPKDFHIWDFKYMGEIEKSLEGCINELVRENSTRRAIIPIASENTIYAEDSFPLLEIMFEIVDNKLNVTAILKDNNTTDDFTLNTVSIFDYANIIIERLNKRRKTDEKDITLGSYTYFVGNIKNSVEIKNGARNVPTSSKDLTIYNDNKFVIFSSDIARAVEKLFIALNDHGNINTGENQNIVTQLKTSKTMLVIDNVDNFPLSYGMISDIKGAVSYILELAYGVRDFELLYKKEDSTTWPYTYSSEIAKYYDKCIENLKNNGSSVIPVTNSLLCFNDDPPCMQDLIFDTNGGKLNFTAVFRSNDAIGGFPLNSLGIIEFARRIANELNIPLGRYTHFANNMHAYGEKLKELETHANVFKKQNNKFFTYEEYLEQVAKAAKEYLEWCKNRELESYKNSLKELYTETIEDKLIYKSFDIDEKHDKILTEFFDILLKSIDSLKLQRLKEASKSGADTRELVELENNQEQELAEVCNELHKPLERKRTNERGEY